LIGGTGSFIRIRTICHLHTPTWLAGTAVAIKTAAAAAAVPPILTMPASAKLEPFLTVRPKTFRLVTTRQHQVLPDTSTHLNARAMAMAEARSLLLSGLEALVRMSWLGC